jgi:hypothetical protein
MYLKLLLTLQFKEVQVFSNPDLYFVYSPPWESIVSHYFENQMLDKDIDFNIGAEWELIDGKMQRVYSGKLLLTLSPQTSNMETGLVMLNSISKATESMPKCSL